MDRRWPSLLAGSRPSSAKDARQAINRIRHARGELSKENEAELRSASEDFQESIQHIRAELREEHAHWAKTAATELYNSRSRFIYELLQNADDAEYEEDVTPCLTFRVRANELIVDINEKGFTYANVTAICATGRSSKQQGTGKTGHKGLGFKSVFGIATRVDVVSGFWSFFFEHWPKDDGLGMVTPQWNADEQEALPEDVVTRFRLRYLHQDRKALEELVRAFEEVPETIVFALNNVAKVKIVLEDVCDSDYTHSFQRTGSLLSGEVVITTTVEGHDKNHLKTTSRPQQMKLRTFQKTLPPSSELKEQKRKNSTVTLAFPVSALDGLPVLRNRGQHVFAYLPVQCFEQLPFLIQADFYMSMSREQIPEHPWNYALRALAVEIFGHAIRAFCITPEDPLLFEWPVFVPGSMQDRFWSDLPTMIIDTLRELKICRSRSGTKLKAPTDLRFLPPVFLHNDEPLLPDIAAKKLYLSNKYDAHRRLFEELGTEELSMEEMVERLVNDMRAPEPKIKTTDLEDEWHSSFCSFAQYVLEDKSSHNKRLLEKEAIIPLASGQWISPNENLRNPIHLPCIHENGRWLAVPHESLHLRVLDPTASQSADRKDFYRAVGVLKFQSKSVIDQIIAAQTMDSVWTRDDSIAAFEILFWLSNEALIRRLQKVKLFAFDSNQTWRRCWSLFFCSSRHCNHQYHALNLLRDTPIERLNATGYGFLHDDYMGSKLSDRQQNGRLWSVWLADIARVPQYPRLVFTKKDRLVITSPIKLIAAYNPSQFVPNLKAHWVESYRAEAEDSESVADQIKRIKVPCVSGDWSRLDLTVLPTANLRMLSKTYGVEKTLPFLDLADDIPSSQEQDWHFLEDFGVICQQNCDFFFAVLMSQQKWEADEYDNKVKLSFVKDAYLGLCETIVFGDEDMLQEWFDDVNGLYCGDSDDPWQAIGDCVWEGPNMLRSKFVLKPLYGDCAKLQNLMVEMLGIDNADHNTIISEIRSLRLDIGDDSEDPDFRYLSDLYCELLHMVDKTDTNVVKDIRDAFETDNLIYIDRRWLNPTSCIWNGPFKLSGKPSIAPSYPDLEDLFVNILNISTMSPAVVVKELIRKAKIEDPDPDELGDLIIAIGQLMDPKGSELDELRPVLDELQLCSFLPVRTGQEGVHLAKTDEAFFFADHEGYAKAFGKKIPLANFPPSDMPAINLLVKALDLEDRYLSEAVVPMNDAAADTSILDEQYTCHLQRRAYALSCCAIRYKSVEYRNRDKTPHSLLLVAEVYASHDLRTSLLIKGGGLRDAVQVKSEKAHMKVERTSESLSITMPADVAQKDSCYREHLPFIMAGILGLSVEPNAVKAIYRIFNDSDMPLSEIMADEVIADVPWLTQASGSDDLVLEVTARSLHGRHRENWETSRFSSRSASDCTPPSAELIHERVAVLSLEEQQQLRLQTISRTPLRDSQQEAYRIFLKNVQQQAQRVPRRFRQWALENVDGFDDMSVSPIAAGRDDDLQSLDPQRKRIALGVSNGHLSIFDECTRIGVAGELFVFELFKTLISFFDETNWESSKRNLVNVLEEYQELTSKPTEDADIVFTDEWGQLYSFLQAHAYRNDEFPPLGFEPEANTGEDGELEPTPVKYLIEVKSTPDPLCRYPFFLSNRQYRLLQKYRLSSSQQRQGTPFSDVKTVYVIVRVFNLFSSNDVDMEIFVDPARLIKKNDNGNGNENGPLNFEGRKYIVTADV